MDVKRYCKLENCDVLVWRVDIEKKKILNEYNN